MSEAKQEQPMTGAQVSSLAKQYREQLLVIRSDMEMRKLALNQTCELLKVSEFNCKPSDVIALAKAMHEFLVQPAASEDSPA